MGMRSVTLTADFKKPVMRNFCTRCDLSFPEGTDRRTDRWTECILWYSHLWGWRHNTTKKYYWTHYQNFL